MFCCTEFLETFAVKVSNVIRKKIKKNNRLMNNSLQNSGAKYVSNKMPKHIRNFSVCFDNESGK